MLDAIDSTRRVCGKLPVVKLFSPLWYSTVILSWGGSHAVVWSILAATLDILAVRAVDVIRQDSEVIYFRRVGDVAVSSA